MLEATDLDNRTLVKESHSICSQVQLRQYGLFLEKNNQKLNSVENIFRNAQLHTNVVSNTLSIECNSSENITILELVESDNKQLSKIVASFAAICEESDAIILENSKNYYQKLLFYGRVNENNNNGLQPLCDDLLLILQKLNCAVKRCQQIINLIIQQLAFMSRKETGLLSNASRLYFQEPIERLGDLLIHLMTLDCLLHTPSLINQWKIYKRAYRAVHHSNKQFNFPLEQLHSLDKLFIQIESSLLSDNIFQNTIDSVDERYTLVGKNSTLFDEFNTFLWNALGDLEKTDSETPVNIQKWLRANVLFVFSFHILGNSDKKYFKHLIDINKKISACTLVGNLLWYPEQFLVRHVSTLVQSVDERLIQSSTVHRQNLLSQKTQNILRDTVQLCQSACVWMIQLEKIVKEGMSHLKLEHLHQRCTFLLQGISLVERIEETLKWITNIHAAEAKPMNRTVLLSIFRLTELLKGLLLVFKTHSISITYCATLVIQYLLYQILVTIRNIKKRLIQDKSHKDRNANALSALQIAEQALNGPSSEKRLLVARIALSTIYSLADSLIAQVRKKMTHVEMLHSLHKKFSQYCDTSFLYWHKVLLSVYFNSVFDSKNDLPRIAYTFYGLTDCSCILKKEDVDGLQLNVKQTFDDKLIIPLCQMVEESLRLHMHSHLQLENGTCFEQGVPEFRSLLNLQPVKFLDNFISIKMNVEHYLSTTFYNLATVVLHDWHTYGEMRRLAYYKHNLDTIEDYLPNQTLEQGLDVLEIMRNIHIFVSKYLYNLNNQIFVEQWSNNKHLNTINIRHIANSIRIHGTGIMNTTVNFTYQFLRKKFYVFSQFMYDEHIKSRLIKDARYFRENKTELDQMYPYDRADKFNRLIRKLGITPTGQTYLDLFRLLISHIGNAMGYIRMIRSGGRHCCSDATCFLPDLDNIADLEPFCEDQQMSNRTTEAAQRLQKDIQTLAGNFIERTEYFKLLVEVFAPVFRNPANMHLRNFYMIVPPLTINFVEHSLACKDRLNKKNKVGAAFTDDGFAMGLAYIIQLLEQGGDLNSLHWFQSIRQKYARDRKNLASQRELINKDDSKLQQTLTLTEKRIQKYQQEFDLLYYSLSSARIFFR